MSEQTIAMMLKTLSDDELLWELIRRRRLSLADLSAMVRAEAATATLEKAAQ